MKNKIILGTAQLGLSYGINNSSGKPSEKDAFNILDYAFAKCIQLLDSADGYGDALSVISHYQTSTNRSFKLINKFRVGSSSLSDSLSRTLDILKSKLLYCYMYHHYPDYETGLVKHELKKLKETGAVQKTGVSLYEVDQLARVVDDPDIDIIQIPANLLDLNKTKINLLKKAKANGKEIHVRSVYLQGLFFKDVNSIQGNLIRMRPYLKKIDIISQQHNADKKKAALNYIFHKEYIDYVVLGIDHVSQLAENLSLVDETFDTSLFEGIEVNSEDMYLLNPANWKQ